MPPLCPIFSLAGGQAVAELVSPFIKSRPQLGHGEKQASALCRFHGGRTLLTAGRGGEIKLWDATTLQAIRTIPNASRSWIEALAGLRKLVASAA